MIVSPSAVFAVVYLQHASDPWNPGRLGGLPECTPEVVDAAVAQSGLSRPFCGLACSRVHAGGGHRELST
jgi:hypothetical protein